MREMENELRHFGDGRRLEPCLAVIRLPGPAVMSSLRNGESRPERRRLSTNQNSETQYSENSDVPPHRQAVCTAQRPGLPPPFSDIAELRTNRPNPLDAFVIGRQIARGQIAISGNEPAHSCLPIGLDFLKSSSDRSFRAGAGISGIVSEIDRGGAPAPRSSREAHTSEAGPQQADGLRAPFEREGAEESVRLLASEHPARRIDVLIHAIERGADHGT